MEPEVLLQILQELATGSYSYLYESNLHFYIFFKYILFCHLIYAQVSKVVASFQVTHAFLISPMRNSYPIDPISLIPYLHNHHISCEI
jgi:hypothetical protein